MQIICRVCRRPLNRSELSPGSSLLVHAFGQVEAADHPVEPTVGTPDARCDVCNGEPVTAVLLVTGSIHLAPIAVSADSWALCAGCETLVSADDWDGLLHRASEALRALTDEAAITPAQLTKQLRGIHSQLRDQASGPPIAVGPPERAHHESPNTNTNTAQPDA